MVNPYRDEAIDSLVTKEPVVIGKRGSNDLWVWFGRPYLFSKRDLMDRYPNAFLPDIAFELLKYHTGDLDTYRGYVSKEEAMTDLLRVRRQLEETNGTIQ